MKPKIFVFLRLDSGLKPKPKPDLEPRTYYSPQNKNIWNLFEEESDVVVKYLKKLYFVVTYLQELTFNFV